jgi:hypothetical protein
MAVVPYKVKLKGKNEELILVESTSRRGVPRDAARTTVQRVAQELSDQMGPISAVANTVRNAFVAVNNPAEIEVEFGLELGGEAGIPVICGGSAKANFKITLTWKNEQGKS